MSKDDGNQQQKRLYETAFIEMNNMLSGKKPVNFKEAVFLMENAFSNGSLSYEQFNTEIGSITLRLQQMVKTKHLEQFRTAMNWAVFKFMTDSIKENKFTPYSYDFDNFMPDKDPSVGFVTKLLRTNKGNCNSLPFLYKILAEEGGANAFLALAPIHCYIKHKDENGKWVNLEMTSGSFARDEWIMEETGVTVEQIKSGIYMNALSQKESIALVMKELAANYQFQFGAGVFDLKVCETALLYFPVSVNLLMVKFEHYRKILLKAREQQQSKMIALANNVLAEIDKKFIELGYRNSSDEEYKNWIKENKMSKQPLSAVNNK